MYLTPPKQIILYYYFISIKYWLFGMLQIYKIIKDNELLQVIIRIKGSKLTKNKISII